MRTDLLLTGGTIRTMGVGDRVVEALAVAGSDIVAIGSADELARLTGDTTRVIDLAGRTVIPGINDGHLHGAWLGARWPSLFFGEHGFGGGHGDAHTDGHDAAGASPRLVETADDRRAALLACWSLLASLGITSYTEPGIGPGEDDGETGCFGTAMLDTYAELAGTHEQTARVTLLRLFGLIDGPSTPDAFQAGLDTPVPRADPRWLAIPGVKIFGDGIPPMGSAWTRTPYRDGGHGGLMTGDGDEASRLAAFDGMVRAAHARGLQIAVHATGDRTIEEFVSLIEELGGARPGRPHQVVHGDLVTPDQLDRMARAGIGIAVQPLISAHTAGWMRGRVDGAVADAAWPLDQMLGTDLGATLGSDAPIASPDWRQTIAAAAQQVEQRGTRVGPAELTRLLHMYTTLPAWQEGTSSWKGTLEVGKVADLCVLDADPIVVGPAGLPAVDVALTIVDGRVVYDARA